MLYVIRDHVGSMWVCTVLSPPQEFRMGSWYVSVSLSVDGVDRFSKTALYAMEGLWELAVKALDSQCKPPWRTRRIAH